jgi:hypothetical protein
MISILLLGFFLPIFAMDNDSDHRVKVAYDMIMEKYQFDSSAAVIAAATNEYRSQFRSSKPLPEDEILSYNEILKQYKDYSDKQMEKASAVVNRSLNDLSQNNNHEYYVWNEHNQTWSLPGNDSPNFNVDGAAMNARILSSKLQLSLKQQLNHEGSGIKKRNLGRYWTMLYKSQSTKNMPVEVLDPKTIKLGFWRSTFGRARMRTAAQLFFKPKIIQVYMSIAAVGYLYFICRDIFGKPSQKSSQRIN